MDLINSLYSRPAGLPSTNASDYFSNSSNSFSMDPFSLALGGASSLINLFGQYQTNKTNLKINEMNNRFNEAESYKAYQRQRSLIAEQNQYNSYENQRALMEAAGYNPNSLVGGTAGTAVSTGSTSSTPASAASPLAAQFQKIDLASSYAMLANLQSQRELNEANADKASADAAATRANTPTDGKNLGDLTYLKLDQDTKLVERNVKLFDATFDDNVRYKKFLANMTQEQARNVKAATMKLYNDIHLSKAEFDVLLFRLPYEVGKIQSETDLNSYKAAEAYASALASAAEVEYKKALTIGQNIQNDYNDVILHNVEFQKGVVKKAIEEAGLFKAKRENEEDLVMYPEFNSSSSSGSGKVGPVSTSFSGSNSSSTRPPSRRERGKSSHTSLSSSDSNISEKEFKKYMEYTPKDDEDFDRVLLAIRKSNLSDDQIKTLTDRLWFNYSKASLKKRYRLK